MSTPRMMIFLSVAAVALAIIIAALAVSSPDPMVGYEETNRMENHEHGLTLRAALVAGAVTGGREIVTRDGDIFVLPSGDPPSAPSRVMTVALGLAIGLLSSLALIYLLNLMFPHLADRLLPQRQNIDHE